MSGELVQNNLTERQRQIVAAVEEGLTKQEIALRLGISHQRVSQLCGQLGLAPVSIKDKRQGMRNEIKRLVLEGYKTPEIATMLGLGEASVQHFRSQLGISEYAVIAERRAKVVHYLGEGKSIKEIASVLQVKPGMVQKDKEALGLSKELVDLYSNVRDRRHFIRKMRLDGMTHEEIAAVLGVSVGAVYLDTTADRLPEETLTQISDLAKAGLGEVDIAEQLNLKRHKVWMAVRKLKAEGDLQAGRLGTKQVMTSQEGKKQLPVEATPVAFKNQVLCPNPLCRNHTTPHECFYRKKGSALRKRDGKLVKRYQCKNCGKYFNAMLMQATRGERRPELNAHIQRLLGQGWSQRKIARALGCNKLTVMRKVRKLKESV